MGSETLNAYTSTGIALTAAGAYNSPFTVTAAGTINTGAQSGVSSNLAAPFLLNAGTIADTYEFGNTIYFPDGGTITNAGLITSLFYGVAAAGAAPKITNYGTIFAGTGVFLGADGTVANTGTAALIFGSGVGPTMGYGVIVNDTPATILNAGTISGADSGVQFNLHGGKIFNTGTQARIAGVEYGVAIQAAVTASTITNAGTISGASGAGIYLYDSPATILNTGTITGGKDGVMVKNDASSPNTPVTLMNAGTIAGSTAALALQSTGGHDRVVAESGAVFIGGVQAAGTGNVLELAGTGATVASIGGQFTGFQTIAFDPGAAWTISGNETALDAAAFTGVTLGDVIDVKGFAATASSYLAGSGLALTSASGGFVLAISKSGGVFNIQGDGNGGTDVEFGTHTLATYTASGIALTASGPDLAPFTVTTAGTIQAQAGTDAVSSTAAAPYLLNQGRIAGGAGAYANSTQGGIGSDGADGVSLNSGTLSNTGNIAGGAGGDGSYFGGNGGAGVDLNSGTLSNTGSISGGAAAVGYYGDGSGGAGINVSDAYVYNSGAITGGSGVGDGAVLGVNSTLVNAGMISGGTGVYASSAGYVTNSGTITGASEDGVFLDAGGTVTNTGAYGLISGGIDGVYAYNAAAYVTNSGTITGASGDGVDLNSGTLSNTGSITGGAGGPGGHGYGAGGAGINVRDAYVYNSGGITGGSGSAQGDGAVLGVNSTLVNSGVISGGIGVFATSAGYVTNSGTITGASGYGVYLGDGGTLTNSGTITGANESIYIYGGGTVTNSGVITGGQAAIVFNGNYTNLLVVDPRAVFNGVVEGGSGLNILEVAGLSSTALTGIGTEYTGFTQLSFASGAAWTLEGDSAGLNGDTVTGFTKADALDITNLSFVSPEYLTLGASSTLTVTEGGSSDTFTFSGDAGYTYTITSDGNTGTEIEEVTCFAAGTNIATARGEVRVEDLAIGDLVQTLHAGMQRIKWIGTRSYVAPFANHKKVLPVRICAGAIADGIPSRDLFVSPGHAICIDEALIHAARLVNGRTITQLERVESVTYYHVELENHEVILAENCPAETFMGEYFRKQFHNAESFSARYPGGQAPEIACLPMLTHGFQLAAILRRLRARAGLTAASTPARLSGYVDVCSATMVSGWAADEAAPDEPVRLDILDGENLIGRVIANIPRADVAAAGFGAGNHGFEFALPPGTTGPITVRRTADRTTLPHANQQSRAA